MGYREIHDAIRIVYFFNCLWPKTYDLSPAFAYFML